MTTRKAVRSRGALTAALAVTATAAGLVLSGSAASVPSADRGRTAMPFGPVCTASSPGAKQCSAAKGMTARVGALAATIWEDQNRPSPAGVDVGAISASTIKDANGKDYPYAYVRASNGHLWAVWWNGAEWAWHDHGTPPGAVEVGAIGGVTVRDLPPGRPDAFVRGSDGHLWVNWWDGTWHWTDGGTPGNAIVDNGAIAAVVVTSGASMQPHAFVRATDGHLWEYAFGDDEPWRDHGTPMQRNIEVGAIAATTVRASQYAPDDERVYVRGSDGHLWLRRQDGPSWTWSDEGTPAGRTVEAGALATLAVPDSASAPARARAYVRASDGHLWARAWNGAADQWFDYGTPSGQIVELGAITAIAVKSSPSATPVTRVFVRASDGHLWAHRAGSTPSWDDQGLANGRTVEAGAIGATSVMTDATAAQQPYAFVRASDGHMWARPSS